MTEYDTVKYVMPTQSLLDFGVLPEDKNTSLTVLYGDAVIHYSDSQHAQLDVRLPLRQEIKFSSLPYVLPNYDTNDFSSVHTITAMQTDTEIAVRGNHYVIRAGKIDEITNRPVRVFSVQMRVNSFLFIIYKLSVPLQIFTGDESSRVAIRAIHGSPGIMDCVLNRNKKYTLLPYTSAIVNPLSDERCTVEVEGRNRMIKIALFTQNRFLNAARVVFHYLHQLCISSMKERRLGPVVLVLGPRNVGKTWLCHFLLNKATGRGLTLIHVDLDVYKNSNTVPGSISLSEVKSPRHMNGDNKKQREIILPFRNFEDDITRTQFYHYLIRKLGQKMRKILTKNITIYSGAIIDVCGSSGEDIPTIRCVSESFEVSHVLVVGEQNQVSYLDNMYPLVGKIIKFIPQPGDIEPIDPLFEEKSRSVILTKYFYGDVPKPEEPDTSEVKLSEVKFYRVVSNPKKYSCASSSTISNDEDFSLEPVTWSPAIEYYLWGVSKAADVTDFSSAIEIEHFVHFTKTDLAKGVGHYISPKRGPLSGKCLIMGFVKISQ